MNNGLAIKGHTLVLTSSGQAYFHVVTATFHVSSLFLFFMSPGSCSPDINGYDRCFA